MITIEILEKFLFVFVLTFIYGLQRQRSHKPVGFGTFILVAVGACALAVTASQMSLENSVSLLAAIVTGIGFLGAGALIRNQDKIFGFTTAASIWLFAIFGLVSGLGDYSTGIIIYSVVWLVIASDNYLEKKGIGSYRKKLTIITQDFVTKEEVTNILAKYCTNFSLNYINANKKERKISLNYLIEGMKKDVKFLLSDLYKQKWCVSLNFD